MSREDRDWKTVDLQDQWIWRWGLRGWLFMGFIGAIVVLWLIYTRAHQVVLPLIVALIIGILLQPFVDFQVRHRIPRWLAVVITMIIIIAVLSGIITVFVYGVTTQAGKIERQVASGVERMQNWLDNLKVSKDVSDWIHKSIKKAWPSVSSGLISFVTHSVPGIASFAIGCFIGFFFLLFLLGDDGKIKDAISRHMGVDTYKAKIILESVNTSIRGYFRGTTVIATVDAMLFIPVTLILGVPLVGPIVLVTFVTCYIPSFGGYIGGAFAVFIALASKGLAAGLIMLVYAILVHTILQNPIQAIAYGKTLQLHPMLALLVTLLGAVFAGIAGAILAVPVTAVVLKVSADLKKAREGEPLEEEVEGNGVEAEPEPEPG